MYYWGGGVTRKCLCDVGCGVFALHKSGLCASGHSQAPALECQCICTC